MAVKTALRKHAEQTLLLVLIDSTVEAFAFTKQMVPEETLVSSPSPHVASCLLNVHPRQISTVRRLIDECTMGDRTRAHDFAASNNVLGQLMTYVVVHDENVLVQCFVCALNESCHVNDLVVLNDRLSKKKTDCMPALTLLLLNALALLSCRLLSRSRLYFSVAG